MEAFKGILNSKSLWLSDADFMNDKYEGIWNEQIANKVIKESKSEFSTSKLKSYKKAYETLKSKKAYMCSFSKTFDKLSQWRAYGDDASGVAIGFSRNAIRLSGNLGLSLTDVIYDKNEQIRLVKDIINTNNTLLLKELAYLYKNPSFYEEEEVRLLYIPEYNMDELTFYDPSEAQYYELMLKNISKLKYRVQETFIKKFSFSIGKFRFNIELNNKRKIPYVEFDLRGTLKGFSPKLIPKIVLGPKNTTDLEELKTLLNSCGLNETEIVLSESSYI
jgi:hypothetical protein